MLCAGGHGDICAGLIGDGQVEPCETKRNEASWKIFKFEVVIESLVQSS